MDLGIKGRRAIVCGASKGLGRACAAALAQEGVDLVIAARTAAQLESTAEEIRSATGVDVIPVAADVATEEGREDLLAVCDRPDILITNAGGPPTGNFRTFSRDAWIAALDQNMLAAIELIRLTIDPMIEQGFGRIVNITSHTVKEPASGLGLSNGARAGLTGFVAGLAREVARHNVVVNNLLPGQFQTDRLRSNLTQFGRRSGKSLEQIEDLARARIPARRFGAPDEFGAMCAYLCSVNVGYLVGQNVLMDGGQFGGLL